MAHKRGLSDKDALGNRFITFPSHPEEQAAALPQTSLRDSKNTAQTQILNQGGGGSDGFDPTGPNNSPTGPNNSPTGPNNSGVNRGAPVDFSITPGSVTDKVTSGIRDSFVGQAFSSIGDTLDDVGKAFYNTSLGEALTGAARDINQSINNKTGATKSAQQASNVSLREQSVGLSTADKVGLGILGGLNPGIALATTIGTSVKNLSVSAARTELNNRSVQDMRSAGVSQEDQDILSEDITAFAGMNQRTNRDIAALTNRNIADTIAKEQAKDIQDVLDSRARAKAQATHNTGLREAKEAAQAAQLSEASQRGRGDKGTPRGGDGGYTSGPNDRGNDTGTRGFY